MAHTYFITGTDTEVGKTFCTTALLQAAAQAGHRSMGFKPIASEADEHGQNNDVLLHQAASSVSRPYTEHNCYTFAEATAPHLAARDENRPINLNRLNQGLAHVQSLADFVLVEGAGGWFTPLNEHIDFADWVAQHKLPVILVVGMKLGCINHALLTKQAVQQAGLPLVGWVANCLNAKPHRFEDYLATLQQRLPAPLLGVLPYAPKANPRELSACFQLNLLGAPS